MNPPTTKRGEIKNPRFKGKWNLKIRSAHSEILLLMNEEDKSGIFLPLLWLWPQSFFFDNLAESSEAEA